jgi:hypothetical protein
VLFHLPAGCLQGFFVVHCVPLSPGVVLRCSVPERGLAAAQAAVRGPGSMKTEGQALREVCEQELLRARAVPPVLMDLVAPLCLCCGWETNV